MQYVTSLYKSVQQETKHHFQNETMDLSMYIYEVALYVNRSKNQLQLWPS